ncbi:MAG: class I SAM-dependent methyltransferase [Planctomycetes bacterium]|nr:class I SAM-dependent methyltransferase [Planctomycetota bacterium]
MTKARRHRLRVAFGDWQTPDELARAVFAILARDSTPFAAVLEPTCGRGAFLVAAAAARPDAQLVGFDVSAEYVHAARERLAGRPATLAVADFFRADWNAIVAELPEPFAIVGNPPWVTNSALGAIEVANTPAKVNSARRAGLDALTGSSNFDISEWMLVRLLEAARERDFELAMLCKATVARRVIAVIAERGWALEGELRSIDAARHFGAAVEAVLLRVRRARASQGTSSRWPVHASLDARAPKACFGIVDGRTCSDLDQFMASRALEGEAELEWRSGIKHDCADVMELAIDGEELVNGFGERVEVETERLYPFLKGSDVGNGRRVPRKRLIVTQRRLGEDTRALATSAPRTWRYLETHRARLSARKSRIFEGQPPYALFGVGDYTFAPYKVAVCGLYKRLAFSVLAPIDEKPVLVDDTCYFLPCGALAEAETLAAALNGELARRFFEARVFWDEKRPIGKALLRTLSLAALLRAEGKAFPAGS